MSRRGVESAIARRQCQDAETAATRALKPTPPGALESAPKCAGVVPAPDPSCAIDHSGTDGE